MRRPVAFAILGVALVVVTASLAGPQTGTSLRITYWQDGAKAGASTTWTLRCGPPRGTLPQAARACRRLASGGPKLFAPMSENAVCTEIYGGPQTARVVGTVGATRVWATFSRTNGCEIARWNRISPWLVPSGGAS
jgi:Subtilisin inhibitor-like